MPTPLNIAVEQLNAGQFVEAERICRQLLKGDRRNPEVIYVLALALFRNGNNAEAIDWLRKLILIRPDVSSYYNELGNMLAQNRQLNDAARYHTRAVELEPNNPDLLANAAKTALAQTRYPQAIEFARKALQLRPDHFFAAMTLATTLSDSGDSTTAIATLRQLVQRYPDALISWNNLAQMLIATGDHAAALDVSAKALSLNPVFHASSHLLTLQYISTLTPQQVATAHLNLGKLITASIPRQFNEYDNDRDPHRRLRIGYVSSDFRQHAVASFSGPMLEQHDRSQFEVFCYSNSDEVDAVTEKLKQQADHWVQIERLDDAQAAKRIHDDRIDVLIDLNGHTVGNRLQMLVHRPAPIQITYIGYPATTGLSAIDYRIADALCDPPGMTEALHSEQLIRLPGCFTCFGPPREVFDIPPLPRTRNGYVTFGSFNIQPKHNAALLDCWARVLNATSGSRLLLKNKALKDSAIQRWVLDRFISAGIAADRIELVSYTATFREHLEMYSRVDIALDPFPYNGTTTTCEALWMGVPVVTLAGQSHVSRVGVSLLTNVGLPDLIAADENQYVATARDLAMDQPRLIQLRSTLRERMSRSPIMDAPGHVRRLEAAYREAWQKWASAQTG